MSNLIKEAIVGSASVRLGPSNKGLRVEQSHSDEEISKDYAIRDKELMSLKEQAFNQGYEQGLSKAFAEAEQKNAEYLRRQEQHLEDNYARKVAELKKELHDVIQAVKKYENELDNEFEKRLLFLTTECLYRLAGRTDVHDSIIKNTITEKLSSSSRKQYTTIRVPPQREQFFTELISSMDDALAVVSDETLAPGDCVMESHVSKMDISLPVQLKQLSYCLAETLEEGKNDL